MSYQQPVRTSVRAAWSVLLLLIALIVTGIGVAIEFSGGWATIVVGGMIGVYSVALAFSERSWGYAR